MELAHGIGFYCQEWKRHGDGDSVLQLHAFLLAYLLTPNTRPDLGGHGSFSYDLSPPPLFRLIALIMYSVLVCCLNS